jgi:Tfp pilus assembly protein PilO
MTARDRTILMVVGALAVLAGFWFLALKPKHAQAQAAAAQITTQQQRLQTAAQTVAGGLQAKAGHADDVATLAELGKALPADDDMPSLLYTLDTSARGAHVQFNSLARSGGSGTTSSSTASPGTGSTTTPSAGAATAALPPGAVVGAAGLATLPFTFTFQGSYFDLKRLLADVHGFVRTSKDTVAVRGRLLTIDGVSLAPDTDSLSKITAKVVATAYLSPASDGAATSGSTAPAATATAAPSSTAIVASNR